jgi:hypothetical protein
MKTFGIILLALLVGFVGYQFAYPKLDDWAQFKTLTEKAVVAAPEEPKPVAKVVAPPAKPVMEEPKAEPKMEPKPEPKPTPAPVVMAEPPKIEANPDEFQPPVFPPIEQVVKGWQEIPKKVFPREVTVLKDVQFVVTKNGNKFGTKVASGGKVHVLEQVGDKVIVAPAPTSPARVEVALSDTNLKELLTDAYERWKPQMVDYLRRQWEFKKGVTKSSASEPATPAKVIAGNGKPERSPDGSYPVLLASMKAGAVTEITPANVKKWGDLNVQKIDGADYYTVIVDYTTKTMFGDFTTSAQARIRDGKVVKWIYTGSGEVVP